MVNLASILITTVAVATAHSIFRFPISPSAELGCVSVHLANPVASHNGPQSKHTQCPKREFCDREGGTVYAEGLLIAFWDFQGLSEPWRAWEPIAQHSSSRKYTNIHFGRFITKKDSTQNLGGDRMISRIGFTEKKGNCR